MNKFRTWLLLLVAAIVPFKGAMAAAGMFCHEGFLQPARTIEAIHPHSLSGSPAVHEHGQHHPMVANSESGEHEDTAPVSTASCTICSAVCSAPPLPATANALDIPVVAGSERFPALTIPRPNAMIGGLERPPRTI